MADDIVSAGAVSAGPYVGLSPYREEDASFFFGRKSETEVITANLMASRLTILYGPSGVGKTSVLDAGVARRLHTLSSRGGNAEVALVVFRAWHDDPRSQFLAEVGRVVRETAGCSVGRPPSSAPLDAQLRSWTDCLGGDLFVILDQFEEYFIYHENEDGLGTWGSEFPEAVMQPDLRVNFLISIREDALSKLDRFKGRISSVFENYLRVEHLSAAAAQEAIEGPLAEFNRVHFRPRPEVSIERALTLAVIEQVQTGEVLPAHRGLGVPTASLAGAAGRTRVEAPYLQLVMSRLWAEELARGSDVLRLGTLEELGGAERIVRTHLDRALSALSAERQATAARAFRYLVTPSGSKITHTVPDLAEYSGIPPAELAIVLAELSDSEVRIVRPVAPPPDEPEAVRYEIFHDVLAAPILDWRARYESAENARRLELEKDRALAQADHERRRARMFRALTIGLVVLFLFAVAATALAIESQRRAQRANSRAVHLAQQSRFASAAAETPADPAAGLVFAAQAFELNPSEGAQQSLREAASQFRRGTYLRPPPRALFSPDGRRVVAVNSKGSAFLWNATTGARIRRLESSGRVSAVAFSPDGEHLATGDLAAGIYVFEAATGRAVRAFRFRNGSVLSVAFNPSGKALLTAGIRNAGLVLDVATAHARLLPLRTSLEASTFSASFVPRTDVVLTLAPGQLTIANLHGFASEVAPAGPKFLFPYGAVPSPGGTMFVTTYASGVAALWRLRNDRSQPTLSRPVVLRGHTAAISAAAFSLDGHLLVTSSLDGTARIWNAHSGALQRKIGGHSGPLLDASFDPTGQDVVTAGADGTARVWSASTGRRVRVLHVSTGVVVSAQFSQNGRTILTDTLDGRAEIWDAARGTVKFPLRTPR